MHAPAPGTSPGNTKAHAIVHLSRCVTHALGCAHFVSRVAAAAFQREAGASVAQAATRVTAFVATFALPRGERFAAMRRTSRR